MKLSCGGLAVANLLRIIKVLPVRQHSNLSKSGDFLHSLKQLGSAKKATIGRVRSVGRILQLEGSENLDLDPIFLSESQCGSMLRAGKARGVAQYSCDFRAEDLVGCPEKEGGVDPAGISHEGRGPSFDQAFQMAFFGS
jgi:hypothetical protein